jgi:hypothetical protein
MDRLWDAAGDWVIVSANVTGATLTAIVLGCKIRDSG